MQVMVDSQEQSLILQDPVVKTKRDRAKDPFAGIRPDHDPCDRDHTGVGWALKFQPVHSRKILSGIGTDQMASYMVVG